MDERDPQWNRVTKWSVEREGRFNQHPLFDFCCTIQNNHYNELRNNNHTREADMARGGKRENAGRTKGEPTKTIRIPIGLLDAVEALIRLYKSEENEMDYVFLNIEIAKTKWCKERGDYTNTNEIKIAARALEKTIEELDKTDPNDPDAEKNWDKAIRLEAIKKEYEQIATYGLDF
jgi:hypothetical protein